MNKRLGALVKEARTHHHLDQAELARILGLNDATLSKIESGHRGLSAEELLSLTLIFQDWFEFRSEAFMEDIAADLATRVREFLENVTFAGTETRKRDWFHRVLCRLDHLYEPQIT